MRRGSFARRASFRVYAILLSGWCVAAGCQQGSSSGGRTSGLTISGLKTFATTYGGSAADRAHDARPTPDGGYVVAGETESFGRGEKDAWVMKLDADGNWEWSRSYGDGNIRLEGTIDGFSAGGALASHLLSVAAGADGGYVLAGGVNVGPPDALDEPDRLIHVFQVAAVKLDSGGRVLWRRTYPGGERGGRILAIEKAGDGYVLAGYVEGRGSNRDGRNRDLLVLAISAAGQELWRKVLGTAEHEVATCLQAARDGGIVVGGLKGRQIADESLKTDAWIVKLRGNSSHDVAWERTYSEGEGVYVYAMRRSLDGGSYAVAGRIQDDVNDSHDGDGATFDAWIVNLNDASGDEEWLTTYATNPQFPFVSDHAFAIEHGPGGGFVVAGYGGQLSRGGMIVTLERDGDPQDGGLILLGADFNDELHAIRQTTDGGYLAAGFKGIDPGRRFSRQDAWVIKLRGDFALEWERAYDLGGDTSRAYSIDESPDRTGYVVAGAGAVGGWVLKIDRQGNEVWRRRSVDRTDEVARSVDLIDADGDGDAGDGFVVAGYTESHSQTGKDAWVLKLDRDGDIQWQEAVGGSGDEEATCVRVTSDGGYVVAGSASAPPPEEAGRDDADVWVFKLDRDGRILWERMYAGEGDVDDVALAIDENPEGGLIVAGNGLDRGFSSGSYVMQLTRGGALDAAWPAAVRFPGRVIGSARATADGGVAVVGHAPRLREGDEGEGGPAIMSDVWVAKVNKAGAVTVETVLGGQEGSDSEDLGFSIAEHEKGGLVVAGMTRSFGGGRTRVNEFGTEVTCSNVWALRLADDLSPAWETTYSTALEDKAFSIRATADGGFILAGETDTSFLALEDGAQRGIDAFVLKIEGDGGLCSDLSADSSARVSLAERSQATAAPRTFSPLGLGGAATRFEAVASEPSVHTICFTLLESFRLTIAVEGRGRVTSSSPPIDCASRCEEMVSEGALVVLNAVPGEGWAFGGWPAECPEGVVRMDSDVTCAVTFHRREEPEEPGHEPPAAGDPWSGYWEDVYTCRESCAGPETTSEGMTTILIAADGARATIEDFGTNLRGSGSLSGRTFTWRGTATLADGRTLEEHGVYRLAPDGRTFTKTSRYAVAGPGQATCSGDCSGTGRKLEP